MKKLTHKLENARRDMVRGAASSRTPSTLNTDIWLHDTERVLRSDERGDKRYVTPTSSDVGANAWRQFWRRSGMAESPPHAFGPAELEHLDRLDRGTAIDPWTTHATV